MVAVLLGGCTDARRQQIPEYLAANPPQFFEFVSAGTAYEITSIDPGKATAEVPVVLRTTVAGIEPLDGFVATAEGAVLAERLDGVLAWAAADVPDDDPLRETIQDLWTQTRREFPLKRLITRPGTEVEAVATLEMIKEEAGWRITSANYDAVLGGVPDVQPAVPVEASPEARATFDEIGIVATNFENLRRDWLAARDRRAEQSLRAMRERLRTGNLYRGSAGELAPGGLRLVISRGVDRGDSVIGVFKDSRRDQSSVRYEGRLRQTKAGDYVWDAMRIDTIAIADGADEFFRSVGGEATVTLEASEKGLSAVTPTIALEFTGRFDVIPEP